MASHPHLFEDQTDEDFFDKLVDDEFGVGGSSEAIGSRLSNLSLGEPPVPSPAEADVVSSEDGSSSVVPSDLQLFGEAENRPAAAEESGPPDSLACKGGEKSKVTGAATSVKVLQWSAFGSSAGDQTYVGGFGSDSDFFPEAQVGESDNAFAPQEGGAGSGVENRGMDVGSHYDNSSTQEQDGVQQTYQQEADAQHYNPDASDSAYWENLYPGWKYDHSTGQWYQVALDGHGGNEATSESGSQETASSIAHLSSNEVVVSEQSASVSCLQQAACPTSEVVAERGSTEVATMDSVTNWNQVSQGNIQYPPNMVFDPQYPEWYYDNITLQWYTLESYVQSVQAATTTEEQDQFAVTGSGSGSLDGWSNNFYVNATDQYGNQPFSGQNGAEVGNQWGERTGTHSTQGAWQPPVAGSTSEGYTSENQVASSVHASTKTLGNYLEKHPQERSSQHTSWQPATATQESFLTNLSENKVTGNYSQKHTPASLSPYPAWQVPMAVSSPESTGSAGNIPDGITGMEKNDAAFGQSSGLSVNGPVAVRGFVPAENILTPSKMVPGTQFPESNLSTRYSGNLNTSSHLQQTYPSGNQFVSNGNLPFSQVTSPPQGRPLAGRPPHALVSFGFGGKLVVMKESGANLSYGSQDTSGKTVSILSLADLVTSNGENSTLGLYNHAYFDSLCKHSFPGPLVGGNAATKDMNKWIDERITSCGSSLIDDKILEQLKLILCLLKISFQHYGKLRSPFGTDPATLETDGPELAVNKLFASVRENAGRSGNYGSVPNCMHDLHAEGRIRKTAAEVQQLLVSGKRQEALQHAQNGFLWGPALVLAAQLGEKFYVETVKKMAQYQFVSGSPLRTLCLLIAGQPADVFSVDGFNSNSSSGGDASKQAVANGILDSWEENLAIITANRTKDDELVMIHLGDCLWKERDEVIAAHTCYLVAESKFESYSDSARLCLIGADHWKCPRTYASPDAIQRTEFYEYSKVLGNSQFVLLPFQPYKLIYAFMLAEVGKTLDSLRYCQAILKILKNSSRTPEAETWKQLATSLEERLRTHQQGGYGSNLAPAKLVGKLFTSIDKSISRMIGTPPPALPPLPPPNNGNDSLGAASNASSWQSTSSLIPSSSLEKINDWTGDNRRIMHNRSVSEPDFGRKQENSGDPSSSTDLQGKSQNAGGSRFGRFGSQIFQKTLGWVARSRPDRQAKLGESNKFYYDEKLQRWVEEGEEPPAQEAALPPPPTTMSFQNAGISDYNINNALSQSLSSNERTEAKPSTSAEPSSSMPPLPPTANQFSARGRLGVRSRYVDTFNKGGGAPATSFQTPSIPTLKPASGANFFVPAPITSIPATGDVTEAMAEASSNKDVSSTVVKDSPYSSLSSSSTPSIPRFPSVDNITPMASKGTGMHFQSNGPITAPTRAASWSGSFSEALDHNKTTVSKSSFDAMSPTSNNISPPSEHEQQPPSVNGANLGDDLHEVEL